MIPGLIVTFIALAIPFAGFGLAGIVKKIRTRRERAAWEREFLKAGGKL